MSEDRSTSSSREEFFKSFLDHLTVPFLKPIAEGFFENVRQVESLIEMPFMMFSMMEVDSHFAKRWESLALEFWHKGEGVTDFLKAYSETLTAPTIDPSFIIRTKQRQDEVLTIPKCGEILQKAIHVLHSAAISGSWTAFECLAADLWVEALNEEPVTLAQPAISSLEAQEPGELTSKQIPVGLAARHGFDLRGCLGTILKSKFDFTGVSGIQKAYKVFEPNDEFITKVLAQPELGELEATRHVIVHRAGRVDEEYRKRTRSSLPVGTAIVFSREQSARFCNVSTSAGIGLLAFVNDHLQAKKSVPKIAGTASPST